MLRIVTLCLLCALLPAARLSAQVLNETEQERLHPYFRAILAEQRPELGISAPAPSTALQNAYPVVAPEAAGKATGRLYKAIVYTTDAAALRAAGIQVGAILEQFVTAFLTEDDLVRLARMDEVRYVDPGSVLHVKNELGVAATGAALLQAGVLNGTAYRGQGTTIVVIDTGIDWKHRDFRDPEDSTRSRIEYIWDATLTKTGSETHPADRDPALTCCSYGVEYTRAQIEDELDGATAGFVRTKDTNNHGTHVAGTAAGNGAAVGRHTGMAPEARLIVIRAGEGRSLSSVDVINALDYVGRTVDGPVVVNYSAGGHQGAHDGTGPAEQAVDAFSGPGRIMVIAAGNEAASNIHASGSLTSGGTAEIQVEVPDGASPESGTGDDRITVDLWSDDEVGATVEVTSPSGITYSRAFNSDGTAPDDTDGSIYLYNAVDPGNLKRRIFLQVSDADANRPPAAGTWTLRLTDAAATLDYDAWLIDGLTYPDEVTDRPALAGADPAGTIGIPGTAREAVTVGSYTTRWVWPSSDGGTYLYSNNFNGTSDISGFSSLGPTRDGRTKPDLTAPGQGIASALSSEASASATRILPGGRHVLEQGTSMATPIAAGAVALLLQEDPTLTPDDVKQLLRENADTDSFTGAVPNNTWGAGKLNVLAAMAKAISSSAAAQHDLLIYDNGTPAAFYPITEEDQLAVRFTPAAAGLLTGVHLQIHYQGSDAPTITGTGTLRCQVFSNVGGVPGTQIGSTVAYDLSSLSPSTLNYLSLLDAGVSVEAEADYHLVFSVANASDEVQVLLDGSPSSRTNLNQGTSWLPLLNNNLIARPEITTLSGIGTVAVDDPEALPAEILLAQNYPNPFNPATTIRYSLPAAAEVQLAVFDLLGRRLATLVDAVQPAGAHVIHFDAADWASGVYFYTLTTGTRKLTRKMLLLK